MQSPRRSESDVINLNNLNTNVLPYIKIPHANFKFLIDTGSTKTIINPKVVEEHYLDYVIEEPFKIKSAHNTTMHKYVAYIPLPKIFNAKMYHKFCIFNFNDKYSGLIGIDLLKKLEANIDIKNKVLKTKYGQIPINFEKTTNDSTYFIKVEPRTSQVVKIPINTKEKEAIVDYMQLKPGLEIPASLVSVNNYEALITITNSNSVTEEIKIKNPIPVIEINNFENFNSYTSNEITLEQDILLKQNMKNLRLSHLNYEEKSAIRKLCFEFRDIFHHEKIPLSFTNQIKHCIRTTDEIPVFQKQYRLPYESQKEVEKQVQNLLKQDIIQNSDSPWSSPVIIVPKKMMHLVKRNIVWS